MAARGNGKPPENDASAGVGQTLEDMADETSEEEDGQVFVIEQGRNVTLGTLIKRGTPVHYEFKLGGKAIKGAAGMGLLAFNDPEMTLVVPVRAGKVEIDPTYDAEDNVKHVTVRASVKPLMVYDSRTEAAQVALRGE